MDHDRFCRWCQEATVQSRLNWFGQYLHLQDEPIHYMEAGEGAPLLLLHGLLAWSYSWRKNLTYLSSAAHVFAPDLRGFGLSDKSRSDHSLEEQANLVLQFMDHLGIEQAVLCGHSMGGEIAMRIAMRAPHRVRALILVAASGYLTKGNVPGEKLLLGSPWLSGLVAKTLFLNRRFVRRTLQTAYHLPEMVTVADVEGYLLPARAPGAPTAFIRMLRSLDFGAHANRYESIQKPALLIWGENDPWVPLAHGKRLAAELPMAELVTLPACGHCPQEEYPELFNEQVLQFLRGLEKQAPVGPDGMTRSANTRSAGYAGSADPTDC